MRAVTALAGEAALPAQLLQDRESKSDPAEGPAAEEQEISELSNAAMEDAKTPVHYFVMGPEAAWHSTSAWPPPELSPEPYTLFLGRSSGCAPLPRHHQHASQLVKCHSKHSLRSVVSRNLTV